MIYDIVGFPSHLMDNVDDSFIESNTSFSLQSSNGNVLVSSSVKSESCSSRRVEFAEQQSEFVNNDEKNNLTSFSEQCIRSCKSELNDLTFNEEPSKRIKLQSDKDQIFEVGDYFLFFF